MGDIWGGLLARGESRAADAQFAFPVFEFGVCPVELLGDVRGKQFDDHFLRVQRAFAVARDLHARSRTRQQEVRAPARPDLDHAGAAVAIRPHARLVAQMRNVDVAAQRRLMIVRRPYGDGLSLNWNETMARRSCQFRSIYDARRIGRSLPQPATDARPSRATVQRAAVSHRGIASRPTAFSVPTRQCG
jgi:hypothetical protein